MPTLDELLATFKRHVMSLAISEEERAKYQRDIGQVEMLCKSNAAKDALELFKRVMPFRVRVRFDYDSEYIPQILEKLYTLRNGAAELAVGEKLVGAQLTMGAGRPMYVQRNNGRSRHAAQTSKQSAQMVQHVAPKVSPPKPDAKSSARPSLKRQLSLRSEAMPTKPPQKKTKARQITCGNCGLTGHTKRSKECLKYCSVIPVVVPSAAPKSTDTSTAEESKVVAPKSAAPKSAPVPTTAGAPVVAPSAAPKSAAPKSTDTSTAEESKVETNFQEGVERKAGRSHQSEEEVNGDNIFSNNPGEWTLLISRVDVIEVRIKEGIDDWDASPSRAETEAFLSKQGTDESNNDYVDYAPSGPALFFFDEFDVDPDADSGDITFGLMLPSDTQNNIKPEFTINTKYIEWRYIDSDDDEEEEADPRWKGLFDKLHTYGGDSNAEQLGFHDDLDNISAAMVVLERLKKREIEATEEYLTTLDEALASANLERVLDKIDKHETTNGYVMVGADKIYVEEFNPEVQLKNIALKAAWVAWQDTISRATWNAEWQYVVDEDSVVQHNITTWALLVAAEQLPAVVYTGNIEEDEEPPVRETSQDSRVIEIWFEGLDDKYEAIVIRNDTSVDPIVIECAYVRPSVNVGTYTITKIPWGNDDFRYEVNGEYLEWSAVAEKLHNDGLDPTTVFDEFSEYANFKLDFENNIVYNNSGAYTIKKFKLGPLGSSNDNKFDAQEAAENDKIVSKQEGDEEEEFNDEMVEEDSKEEDVILNAHELLKNGRRGNYYATDRRGPPWEYLVSDKWVSGTLLEPHVDEEVYKEEEGSAATDVADVADVVFDPDALYQYTGSDYKQGCAVLHQNDVVRLVRRPGRDTKLPYLQDTDFYWDRYVVDRRRRLRPDMYKFTRAHIALYDITRSIDGTYSVYEGGRGAVVQGYIRSNVDLAAVATFVRGKTKKCPRCGKRYRHAYNRICQGYRIIKNNKGKDVTVKCKYNFTDSESKESSDKDELDTVYERFTIYANFLKGELDTEGFEKDIDDQLKGDGLLPVINDDGTKTEISTNKKETEIKNLGLATECVSVCKTNLGPDEPQTIFQDIDFQLFDVVTGGNGFNPDIASDEEDIASAEEDIASAEEDIASDEED